MWPTLIKDEDIQYYDLPGAPLVRVYTNLLPNNDKILEVLKRSEENPEKYELFGKWTKWNDLGTHVSAGLPEYAWDAIKRGTTDNLDNLEIRTEEEMLLKEVYDAYFTSLQNYGEDHGLPKDLEVFPDGPSFYRYDHSLPAPSISTPEFNMNYHTDFAFSLKDNPGKKPITTCTMYFNDDYDGGHMVFNLEDRLSRPYYKRSEQYEDDEILTSGGVMYKPSAGDVVVFPSGNPDFLFGDKFYFHCVNRVMGGDKYFASIFNSYEYHGSEVWQEGIEEYGKDLWLWLEKRRVYRSGYKKKAVDLDE